MKTIEGVEFGDKVTITHKLVRRSKPKSLGYNLHLRYWRPYHINETFALSGCVFIGYRTLSNGELRLNDYSEYTAKEHFRAAVVVTGPGVNPIYVPLEGVKIEKFR